MSPTRSQAAARVDEVAPSRVAPRPLRLQPAETPRSRLSGVGTVLRSGNLIGRVGTLTAVALFVAVFGIVVFQALLVQGQARLDHLNGQIADQQQTSKQLHLELAQLDSPARIVTAARALGMIDPGDVVYLQPSPTDDAKARLAPSVTSPSTPRPGAAHTGSSGSSTTPTTVGATRP